MTVTLPRASADLLSTAAIADPHRFYGELREHDPVHWAERQRSWVLTRYDDVAAAFVDQRLSSDRVQPVFDEKLSEAERVQRAPAFSVLADWMVFKDPPDHGRLRDSVKRAFTPRSIRDLRPRIREVVEELLADLPAAGEIDLLRSIAYPVPALVIAELLGVPEADRDLFKTWSNEVSVLVFGGAQCDHDRARAQAGLVALAGYLRELAARYRTEPADNVLSSLVAGQSEPGGLTDDELVHTCVLLLFGGHETTTNLIANGFLALIDHPDQRARLLAEPGAVTQFPEELNRFDGPSRMVVRRAVEPIELHGQRICAGDRVLLCQSSANRDPRRFADPDRLDLTRQELRHVAFGWGIHYCLGASLARLEVEVAVPRIVRAFGGAKIAGELEWVPLIVVRGLRSCPIRWGGRG